MLCNTYLQRRALDLGNWKKRGLRLSLSRKAGILRFRPSSIAVSEMGDSDGSPVSRDDYYVVDGLRLVRALPTTCMEWILSTDRGLKLTRVDMIRPAPIPHLSSFR